MKKVYFGYFTYGTIITDGLSRCDRGVAADTFRGLVNEGLPLVIYSPTHQWLATQPSAANKKN